MANSALYSAQNLATLTQTASKWITRVPATLSEAQAAMAQAEPQAIAPLHEGYGHHEVLSTYGGVVQRWVLIYSDLHQVPGNAAFQALATFEQDLQATFLSTSAVHA